ncbi:STAS domain-containing protein [Lysobacter sp. A6]|uniref:STAS domain-containing protein n=1 Tax=Noviluteimonas lactosilytica TaxID=2888523 RepID=A0ABS8JHY1_9GAMM|nr:STAS domain-containing protein [Lysobacter lactosilyticus]MCC8363120.1 STAS domain-containing protein [Lysobacter lactosilyticus]
MKEAARNAAPVAVVRDGDMLVVSGALVRAAVAGAWTRALPLIAGVRRIDLAQVAEVDSAGMALLAELAARAGGGVTVVGHPAGLADLRAAYRLDDSLAFASA